MIAISDVTKRYGPTVAVDGLSFEVRAGEVTGFLGPNGAGKSTTMRMMVGLDAPTSGRVTIDGGRYQDLRFPLHHVGALLEAKAIHPGRSARSHLRRRRRAQLDRSRTTADEAVIAGYRASSGVTRSLGPRAACGLLLVASGQIALATA